MPDQKKFEPARVGELDDLALLPGEFRAFRAEIRSAFELLTNRIMPALERIEQRQDHQDHRITAVERAQRDTQQRIEALEAERRPRKKAPKTTRR